MVDANDIEIQSEIRESVNVSSPPLRKSVAPPKVLKSLFHFPKCADEKADDFLPKLRDFKCPLPGCEALLREQSLSSLPQYNTELNECYSELESYHREMQSYQRCCLSDIVCGLTAQPVRMLMQLGKLTSCR
jgi:hypothetical protein